MQEHTRRQADSTFVPGRRGSPLRQLVCDRWPLWFGLLLFAGACSLFSDYGLGWDTPIQTAYGERVLDFWLSGGLDRRANTELGWLHHYGVLFELPSAALHRAMGLDPYRLRGLLSAVLAIATLPPVIRLARRLGGERAAVASALSLVLMPAFFGHAFINEKDIPLACGVAWCAWSAVRLVAERDHGWGAWLMAGLAAGFTLGIRIGAIFIVAIWLAPLALAGWQERQRWRVAVVPGAMGRQAVRALAAVGVVLLLVVVPWPHAIEDPCHHLLESIRMARAFPAVFPVLFNGDFILSDRLPVLYLPVYLGLSLSPILLVGLAVGVLLAVRSAWRRPESRLLLVIVAAWGVLPVVAVMILRPNMYDTIRQFLFTLPAFAVLTGWGWAAVADRMADALHRTWIGLLVLAVFCLVALVPLVRWHPYQYAYTNWLAGDPAGRHRRWETDYWVTSYREAAEWINARQRESARPVRVIVAANNLSWRCFAEFLDARVQWRILSGRGQDPYLPKDTDYYVGTVRYGMADNLPRAPVVYSIQRAGVLLAVIKGHPSLPGYR